MPGKPERPILLPLPCVHPQNKNSDAIAIDEDETTEAAIEDMADSRPRDDFKPRYLPNHFPNDLRSARPAYRPQGQRSDSPTIDWPQPPREEQSHRAADDNAEIRIEDMDWKQYLQRRLQQAIDCVEKHRTATERAQRRQIQKAKAVGAAGAEAFEEAAAQRKAQCEVEDILWRLGQHDRRGERPTISRDSLFDQGSKRPLHESEELNRRPLLPEFNGVADVDHFLPRRSVIPPRHPVAQGSRHPMALANDHMHEKDLFTHDLGNSLRGNSNFSFFDEDWKATGTADRCRGLQASRYGRVPHMRRNKGRTPTRLPEILDHIEDFDDSEDDSSDDDEYVPKRAPKRARFDTHGDLGRWNRDM